jgi:ADP-ribose pyrophosphatase YjhB (NUDIX family)
MSGIKVIPSVFTAIIDDGKVLLLRRANTGWLDGYYDLPAGHLEKEETFKEGAVRELEEETKLKVLPEDLRLIHAYQNYNYPDRPHYGYIFQARRWNGIPQIGEPDKCDDLAFFPLDKLPTKITPTSADALENLDSEEVTFSYYKPGEITG